MDCPDCNTEMEVKTEYYIDKDGHHDQQEEPYYRCPKCFIVINPDTEDYL